MYYVFLVLLITLVYFIVSEFKDDETRAFIIFGLIIYLMIPCFDRYFYKSRIIKYKNYDAKIKVLKDKQAAVENFLLSIKLQPGYLVTNDSPYNSAINSKLETEKELADMSLKKIELKTKIEYAPKSFFGVWIKEEKI